MSLDAGPPGVFFGGALVVGIEDRCDIAEDGTPGMRAYLHARYRGIYVLLDGEAAEHMRRAWNGTHTTHLFVRFDPDGDVTRYQTPEGKAWDERVAAQERGEGYARLGEGAATWAEV